MMGDFQNGLISRIFVFFSSGFLHRTAVNHCRSKILALIVTLHAENQWLNATNGRKKPFFGITSAPSQRKNALKAGIISFAVVIHVRRQNVRKESEISDSLYPLHSYV